MAQRDFLSRLADAGEDAIRRVGPDRVLGVVTTMRDQMDALTKRVRGMDELEQRIEDLERELAKMQGSSGRSTTTRRAASTAKRGAAATTRTSAKARKTEADAISATGRAASRAGSRAKSSTSRSGSRSASTTRSRTTKKKS